MDAARLRAFLRAKERRTTALRLRETFAHYPLCEAHLVVCPVPVLVMHGDDDQIVPRADSGPLSAKLAKDGTLKTYSGFPHGMPTTQAETINADLLAFLRA